MFGIMLASGLAYTAYRYWGGQAPSLNISQYLPQPEVVMRNIHATFGPSPVVVKSLANRMLSSSKSQEMMEFCSGNEKDGFYIIRGELSVDEKKLIHEFIANFLNIGDSETERQESPYFNQLYVSLCKDNKETLARVVDYFTFDEEVLSNEDHSYIVYRLKKEFLLENLKKDPELVDWKVINVPGDGSCLLWACLVASGKDETSHNQMLDYRREMARIFRKEIKKNKDFANRFDIHIQSHAELSKKVGTSEGRVDRYCALLEASKTWNDNFEAELLAKAMKKTIVILEGPDEKNLKVRDVAGIFCSEKYEEIIFVQYQSEHYKALVSDWLIVDRLD